MSIRYLLVFAVWFAATFLFPDVFSDLSLRILLAGGMTGVTWLVQPAKAN